MMLLTSAVKLARACLRLFWAIKMGARLGNNPKLRSKGWVTVNCMLVESDGFTILKEYSKGWVTVNCMLVESDGFTILKELFVENLLALKVVWKSVPVEK